MYKNALRIRLVWALAGIMSFFLLSAVWAEEGFVLQDPILEKDGIEYALTGVADSKDDPRWNAFPLKIVFATGSGELYTDINVEIRDANNKKIFSVKADAPWLLVKLPAGNYTVHAKDMQGVQKSTTVAVPSSGQREYTFKW